MLLIKNSHIKWAPFLVHNIVAFNFMVVKNYAFSGQKQPPEVFYQKGVFKNFVNFTGKQLCWSFFLINLQA